MVAPEGGSLIGGIFQSRGTIVSENHQEKIEELMDEASLLEYGPTKIALLEEAVRLADSHADADYGFAAREEYIQACTFGGYPEKSLVAFSWCLAQCDRNPQKYSEEAVLWKYKWVVGCLTGFPQIPRTQVEEMFADMSKRFERTGAGQRAVAKLRCDVAMDFGDRALAQQYERTWQLAPRDWLSDCHACEVDLHVEYCIFLEQDERAIAEARPILRGSQRCEEVPHRTYARLLVPYFRLGRLEDAMKCHKRGYRMISKNHKYLKHVARHLLFLTLTDNLDRATKVFQKHLPWCFGIMDLSQRYEFFLPSLVLLERLGERKNITLRLPKDVALHREDGRYEISAISAWLESEIQQLARRFDQRNGTDYFTRRYEERGKYHDLIRPFPYSADAE